MRYTPPFYERIEVIVPFCGVVVTIILIMVAIGIYWRRRRELKAERLAAKVDVASLYVHLCLQDRQIDY